MKKTREQGRKRRQMKIRKSVRGTTDRPRVFLYRSNKAYRVGAADDSTQKVLASMEAKGKNLKAAEQLGKDFGKQLKKLKVKEIVFDRSGYKYHGNVKALADAIRSEGIQF